MLRYNRQIKPGLVALYDIRPGNGAGLFLQPQSPHGVVRYVEKWHQFHHNSNKPIRVSGSAKNAEPENAGKNKISECDKC